VPPSAVRCCLQPANACHVHLHSRSIHRPYPLLQPPPTAPNTKSPSLSIVQRPRGSSKKLRSACGLRRRGAALPPPSSGGTMQSRNSAAAPWPRSSAAYGVTPYQRVTPRAPPPVPASSGAARPSSSAAVLASSNVGAALPRRSTVPHAPMSLTHSAFSLARQLPQRSPSGASTGGMLFFFFFSFFFLQSICTCGSCIHVHRCQ
jgi:hypothetical protein